MCISQFTRAKIFRFLSASVTADSLKGFQAKIDRLYSDLTLWGITDIEKKLPKIAPQSQELYTYQNRVGIESGRERVINLLDLNLQDTSSLVVVVYGFGGIGKTTLADAVYAQIDLKNYRHCRIHMDENCNKRDLKKLQEQILQGLCQENVKLTDCDQGRGMLSWSFQNMANHPVFLYIDNGLKETDLRQLLPEDLSGCLPQRSRILVTTRNLHETDIFLGSIPRQAYSVTPLPRIEARKILLKKAADYNDENNIDALLRLCDGVPLLLQIAGSQLADKSGRNYLNNIVLDLLRKGEKVEEGEISNRMVDFVYNRMEQPVKEAFLDISFFFYNWKQSKEVAYIVGEEAFRALEEASFVKTSEDGKVIIHDIVRARGRKMSGQHRITDRESILDCLNDKEKLRRLKGIRPEFGEYGKPKIEINEDHFNWMGNSLRVFSDWWHLSVQGKFHKPFKELRFLDISGFNSCLPMEFQKLGNLAYYNGPLTEGISLYDLPSSLRILEISGTKVAFSKMPPNVTLSSTLVKLNLSGKKNLDTLPDGIEQLTMLEKLDLSVCPLKELPSKFVKLKNLKELDLFWCCHLKELPSDFGDLGSLETLYLSGCCLNELPSSFGKLGNLKCLHLNHCRSLILLPPTFVLLNSLKLLILASCSGLIQLPSDIGQLQNMEDLRLTDCTQLKGLPLSFRELTNMKKLYLFGCSTMVKKSVFQIIREPGSIVFDVFGFSTKVNLW